MSRCPTVMAVAVVAVLLVVVAGCAGDDNPNSAPSSSPKTGAPTIESSQPSPADQTSPSADIESWRADYDGQQLRAFDQAIGAWKQYLQLMEGYRREPVDRVTVQKVFERYTHSATTLTASYVANYVEGGVRQLNPPTPLTWRARKIELNQVGGLIVFDQCTDYTTLEIRRDGEPLDEAKPKNDRAILRVRMASDGAGSWRQVTSKLVDKPCE